MGSNVYVAASGAEARLRQLELVANNLANAESVGYKADRPIFHAAVEAAIQNAEGDAAPGAAGGVYVRIGETGFDYSSGPLKRTGSPLDVAIDGEGFFAVDTPEGERYTRAGSFQLDTGGVLVTAGGQPVLGDGGPIEITSTTARITANGDVVDDREPTPGELPAVLGTLRVVEFEELDRLTKAGDGLFRAPADVEPVDSEFPALLPGSLEGSNVKPVVELATLMILQRAFEASMEAMQRDDQATQRLIQEISQ